MVMISETSVCGNCVHGDDCRNQAGPVLGHDSGQQQAVDSQ